MSARETAAEKLAAEFAQIAADKSKFWDELRRANAKNEGRAVPDLAEVRRLYGATSDLDRRVDELHAAYFPDAGTLAVQSDQTIGQPAIAWTCDPDGENYREVWTARDGLLAELAAGPSTDAEPERRPEVVERLRQERREKRDPDRRSVEDLDPAAVDGDLCPSVDDVPAEVAGVVVVDLERERDAGGEDELDDELGALQLDAEGVAAGQGDGRGMAERGEFGVAHGVRGAGVAQGSQGDSSSVVPGAGTPGDVPAIVEATAGTAGVDSFTGRASKTVALMAEPWLVDSFAPPAGATSTWGGACPRRWFHIDDRRRRPAPRWTSSGLATLIGRAW